MDLTEAEDIKKRWQEYTEDLYKKDLHDQYNHDHTIVIIWVVKIFFVQFFCVFSPPLPNIFCFCSIHIISVLYCAHLCMKFSLCISNFLEEISSLSHSVVFLYFFALIAEEGFLISPCYSLEPCIQIGISTFSSLPLASLLFSAICKASSDNHFAFLFLGDGLDHCLLYNVTNLHPYFFSLSLYQI